MKKFLRGLAVLVLAVSLSIVALWRQNALPDLSVLQDLVHAVAAGAEQARQLITSEQKSAKHTARPVDAGATYVDYHPEAGLDANLEAAIVTALREMRDSVDVGAFHLTGADVGNAVNAVQYAYPEFFYVSATYRYDTSQLTGKVQTIRFTYQYDAATVAAMRETYRAALAAIAAGAPAEGTELDLWLYLHDYFVKHYTYDYSETPIRDAYGLFTQKTGVCQAYMLGLIAAAQELGLEALPVTSSEMKHAWNLVKLNGNWYHVDVTWDDSSALPGYTRYTYFLQSDSGITADEDPAKAHRAWSATQSAPDTTFDGAVFHGAITPFLKVDGTYYGVLDVESEDSMVQGSIFGGADLLSLEEVHAINARWSSGGNRYFVGCFSGLSAHGGVLYYTTPKTLRAFDLATGVDHQVKLFGLAENIYGIWNDDGATITMITATSPSAANYHTLTYTYPH